LGYQLHDAVVVVVLACTDHVERRRLCDHGREKLFPLVLRRNSEKLLE
jgi:hypothetical protein